MIVIQRVNARDTGHAVWQVYSISVFGQSTLAGNISADRFTWKEVREAFEGIVINLGEIETTPEHFRPMQNDVSTPLQVRRKRDAIAGN